MNLLTAFYNELDELTAAEMDWIELELTQVAVWARNGDPREKVIRIHKYVEHETPAGMPEDFRIVYTAPQFMVESPVSPWLLGEDDDMAGQDIGAGFTALLDREACHVRLGTYEDCGAVYPGRLAWFVQMFLKRHRPKDCWTLNYVELVDKPQVDGCCGGSYFVTAHEIEKFDAYGRAAQYEQLHKLGYTSHWQGLDDPCVEDWQNEVMCGNTMLGYWDWVLSEMEARGTDSEDFDEQGEEEEVRDAPESADERDPAAGRDAGESDPGGSDEQRGSESDPL